jgi:5-methylcytosine-specific restriction endonuclease McrA
MFPGCWMCGGDADTVDHVKPLSKGGAHILANLRSACQSCNSSKGATWPFDLAA